MNFVYTRRVVAFIDILGFREHVSRTVRDPEHAKRVKSVLTMINGYKVQNDEGPLALRDIGREVTVFSDSIVISYPCDRDIVFLDLFTDIIHLQLELLNRGILMRGGVSYGDLYHDGNILFGPAMIKAYDLESKYALHPRVIIDPELFEDTCELYDALCNYGSYSLRKDEDEFYFVDFLGEDDELDSKEALMSCLAKAKILIDEHLNDDVDPRIKSKYEWFRDYFNSIVNRFRFHDYESY